MMLFTNQKELDAVVKALMSIRKTCGDYASVEWIESLNKCEVTIEVNDGVNRHEIKASNHKVTAPKNDKFTRLRLTLGEILILLPNLDVSHNFTPKTGDDLSGHLETFTDYFGRGNITYTLDKHHLEMIYLFGVQKSREGETSPEIIEKTHFTPDGQFFATAKHQLIKLSCQVKGSVEKDFPEGILFSVPNSLIRMVEIFSRNAGKGIKGEVLTVRHNGEGYCEIHTVNFDNTLEYTISLGLTDTGYTASTFDYILDESETTEPLFTASIDSIIDAYNKYKENVSKFVKLKAGESLIYVFKKIHDTVFVGFHLAYDADDKIDSAVPIAGNDWMVKFDMPIFHTFKSQLKKLAKGASHVTFKSDRHARVVLEFSDSDGNSVQSPHAIFATTYMGTSS